MKKILFILGVVFISFGAKAQIDLSINPIIVLFGDFDIPIEYRATSDIGVELTPGFNFGKYGSSGWDRSGFGLRLIGKYYFNPENGCDKWNIGPYIQYQSNSLKDEDQKATNSRLAIGFYGGYKWVSARNIIFELGFGLGRALFNNYSSDDDSVNLNDFADLFNYDFTGKLAVGYRFGGGK